MFHWKMSTSRNLAKNKNQRAHRLSKQWKSRFCNRTKTLYLDITISLLRVAAKCSCSKISLEKRPKNQNLRKSSRRMRPKKIGRTVELTAAITVSCLCLCLSWDEKRTWPVRNLFPYLCNLPPAIHIDCWPLSLRLCLGNRERLA